MKLLKLADFLNMFSWGQVDLAREAGVSPHCVSRALKGERIARRNALKIVEALDRKFQAQGAKGHITMGSIKGLQIAELQRKKRPQSAKYLSVVDPPPEKAE